MGRPGVFSLNLKVANSAAFFFARVLHGPGWISVMVGRWSLLLGFVCLATVVLTHVTEWLRVFPDTGGSLRNSPGHYLDSVSAVFGCALLIAGMIWISFNARRSS
jgi:hypothetical protein